MFLDIKINFLINFLIFKDNLIIIYNFVYVLINKFFSTFQLFYYILTYPFLIIIFNLGDSPDYPWVLYSFLNFHFASIQMMSRVRVLSVESNSKSQYSRARIMLVPECEKFPKSRNFIRVVYSRNIILQSRCCCIKKKFHEKQKQFFTKILQTRVRILHITNNLMNYIRDFDYNLQLIYLL